MRITPPSRRNTTAVSTYSPLQALRLVYQSLLLSAALFATGCNSIDAHYRQISSESHSSTTGDIPILSKYPPGGGYVLVGEIDVSSRIPANTFIRQLKSLARRKGANAVVVRGESSYLQQRNIVIPSYVATVPTTTSVNGSASTFTNRGSYAQTTFLGVANSSQAVVVPGTSGTITESVTDFTADFIRYDALKKFDQNALAKLPFGKPTDREGFVKSPYSNATLCVTAISRGDPALCPATGKKFRVP
jgi:hypothetical protein